MAASWLTSSHLATSPIVELASLVMSHPLAPIALPLALGRTQLGHIGRPNQPCSSLASTRPSLPLRSLSVGQRWWLCGSWFVLLSCLFHRRFDATTLLVCCYNVKIVLVEMPGGRCDLIRKLSQTPVSLEGVRYGLNPCSGKVLILRYV